MTRAGAGSQALPGALSEVVASLVLLADRRSGRRSGWLPWAAPAAGTTASLAANVAAVGAGPVGRLIAGWPAFALLVAVKLLSGMREHRHGADRLAGTQDRPVPVQDRPPAAQAGGGRSRHGRQPHGRSSDDLCGGTAGQAGWLARDGPASRDQQRASL
jgi:hypothetical protein